MLGPVSASMGDCLWTGKPPRCRTRHPGLLSLSVLSVAGWNQYLVKAGRVNRHIAWHTSRPYLWSHSVVLVPSCTDWLAETSADLWEAVAHLRHVGDDALYKYTINLLYNIKCQLDFPNLQQKSVWKAVVHSGKLVIKQKTHSLNACSGDSDAKIAWIYDR